MYKKRHAVTRFKQPYDADAYKRNVCWRTDWSYLLQFVSVKWDNGYKKNRHIIGKCVSGYENRFIFFRAYIKRQI